MSEVRAGKCKVLCYSVSAGLLALHRWPQYQATPADTVARPAQSVSDTIVNTCPVYPVTSTAMTHETEVREVKEELIKTVIVIKS